jgi:hypothetical protein
LIINLKTQPEELFKPDIFENPFADSVRMVPGWESNPIMRKSKEGSGKKYNFIWG